MKHTKIILAFIILLGAFLRIYGLGDESFWIDESETVYASTQSSLTTVLKNVYYRNTAAPEYFEEEGGKGSMPFYFTLTYYWTRIFGLGEFKLRILSALFGIASIYLTFLVSRTILNEKIALLSAFLISINYYNVYYSQEARSYSFLVFITLLGIYFFIKALNENMSGNCVPVSEHTRKSPIFDENKYWVAYTASRIVLLYTH